MRTRSSDLVAEPSRSTPYVLEDFGGTAAGAKECASDPVTPLKAGKESTKDASIPETALKSASGPRPQGATPSLEKQAAGRLREERRESVNFTASGVPATSERKQASMSTSRAEPQKRPMTTFNDSPLEAIVPADAENSNSIMPNNLNVNPIKPDSKNIEKTVEDAKRELKMKMMAFYKANQPAKKEIQLRLQEKVKRISIGGRSVSPSNSSTKTSTATPPASESKGQHSEPMAIDLNPAGDDSLQAVQQLEADTKLAERESSGARNQVVAAPQTQITVPRAQPTPEETLVRRTPFNINSLPSAVPTLFPEEIPSNVTSVSSASKRQRLDELGSYANPRVYMPTRRIDYAIERDFNWEENTELIKKVMAPHQDEVRDTDWNTHMVPYYRQRASGTNVIFDSKFFTRLTLRSTDDPTLTQMIENIEFALFSLFEETSRSIIAMHLKSRHNKVEPADIADNQLFRGELDQYLKIGKSVMKKEQRIIYLLDCVEIITGKRRISFRDWYDKRYEFTGRMSLHADCVAILYDAHNSCLHLDTIPLANLVKRSRPLPASAAPIPTLKPIKHIETVVLDSDTDTDVELAERTEVVSTSKTMDGTALRGATAEITGKKTPHTENGASVQTRRQTRRLAMEEAETNAHSATAVDYPDANRIPQRENARAKLKQPFNALTEIVREAESVEMTRINRLFHGDQDPETVMLTRIEELRLLHSQSLQQIKDHSARSEAQIKILDDKLKLFRVDADTLETIREIQVDSPGNTAEIPAAPTTVDWETYKSLLNNRRDLVDESTTKELRLVRQAMEYRDEMLDLEAKLRKRREEARAIRPHFSVSTPGFTSRTIDGSGTSNPQDVARWPFNARLGSEYNTPMMILDELRKWARMDEVDGEASPTIGLAGATTVNGKGKGRKARSRRSEGG